MTIPGNGKTYFIQQLEPMLQKYDIPFYFVSADEIRRDIMNNLVKRKRISLDQAFKESGRPSNFEFEKELKDVFDEIYQDNRIKKAVIYIDKNHPPNAISRSTEPIRKYLSEVRYKIKNLKLEFIAIIPDCINNFEFTKNKNKSFIPFSLTYFIQCYLRVKNRNDHPTLNGDNKELMSIFGIFIQNFINVKLDESNIISYHKLDKAIKLPFTDEITENQFPEDLVKTFSSFCGSLITNSRDNNSENRDNKILCKELEELILKYFPKNKDFFPTKNLVASTAEPIVSKLFNLNQCKIDKIENFVYLGIVINGNNNANIFVNVIINCLKKILDKCGNSEIKDFISKIENNKNNYYELSKGWKYPHNIHKNYWHCTTLFKGGKKIYSIKNNREYIEFSEGKNIKVDIIGFVYVPQKIMISIVYLNGEKCDNEFPHITTFINEYVPKQSNDVMIELFKNNKRNKDIIDIYNNKIKACKEDKINNNKDNIVYEKTININKENINCYGVFFDEKCK